MAIKKRGRPPRKAESERSSSSSNGRPKGSKNIEYKPTDTVLTELCVSPKCRLTTDCATVVSGARTRYVRFIKPPYNAIKLERVRCQCGQYYLRRTAVYRENN